MSAIVTAELPGKKICMDLGQDGNELEIENRISVLGVCDLSDKRCAHTHTHTHTHTQGHEVSQERRMRFSSVQISCSVLSDSLRPHELQHARPPRPSPTPGVHPNPCLSSRCRCHPTISSSVIPLSSCLQSIPASGSFQMSQFFPSGGQIIGVSASTSVLLMNTQD